MYTLSFEQDKQILNPAGNQPAEDIRGLAKIF